MKRAILILVAFTLFVSCKDNTGDDTTGSSTGTGGTDTSYQQDYTTTTDQTSTGDPGMNNTNGVDTIGTGSPATQGYNNTSGMNNGDTGRSAR